MTTKKNPPRGKAGQDTYQAREGIRANSDAPACGRGVFVDPVFGPCRSIVLGKSELFILKMACFGRVGAVRIRMVVGSTD